MNKRMVIISTIFILLLLQFVVITPKAFADCYKTTEGNNCTIKYNSDNTKITSITVDFSYIDNVNLIGQNNSKRQYNLIFTKDPTKKAVTTAGQARVSLKNLAARLGITDAIYSDASIVGQAGVTYTGLQFEEGDALCSTTIKRSKDGKCTLITGTYTITDRTVLGKFEPNTTYYGLLCSGFSDGSGSWYTNVSIDVQINENKAFVVLDDTTKPVITVTSNHNPVQNGDILTAASNADEITYNWYYDDNEDGIPDEGTLIGTGETYTVKCPDASNPTHDDTEHKIICVATQNKDGNGNALAEEFKPKQISTAVSVRGKANDVSSTEIATQKAGEVLTYNIIESENLSSNSVKLDENDEGLLEKIGFTEEELSAKANGKNISVYLEVKDIGDSISESDKEKIEAILAKNQKIGLFLDINLFKKIDEQEATKITKTNSKIKVSFEIPENILKTPADTKRTITVLKLHDGMVSEIEVDVNGNVGTFETDEFSIYALSYKDENISVKNPPTRDAIGIYIGLIFISMIGLSITVKSVKKN